MALWAVDCHVHFYDGFDLDVAARRSWLNLRRPDWPTLVGQCWCLASPPSVDGLALVRALALCHHATIRLSDIQEPNGSISLLIEHEEGPILVVPGTQAISVEGLEVLSLGVELPNADRVSVAELVNYVQAAGGVPVIPWGVGKWIGRRGKLVEGLLQNKDTANNLLLADNANRPWWWPYPKLLKAAARANRSVVSGSDPLPVRGDEVRIGSAGVLCDVDSKDTAWPQIRQYLDSLNGADVATFGDPMASTQLWHKQISLRMASKV